MFAPLRVDGQKLYAPFNDFNTNQKNFRRIISNTVELYLCKLLKFFI